MEGCVNGKYYIETNTYTRAEGNFYRQIRFNKKKTINLQKVQTQRVHLQEITKGVHLNSSTEAQKLH